MSPTCSSRFLVGKKTRSAAARTTPVLLPRGNSMLPRNTYARKPMACASGRARGNRTWRGCTYNRRADALRGGMFARAVRAWRIYVVAMPARGRGMRGGERQDENEPAGNFPVEVVEAKFPEKQKLAKSSDLVVTVRNAGKETIPNIGHDRERLRRRKNDPDLADPTRPVFAMNGVQVEIAGFPEAKDAAPRGCDTAYVNTWACGPLSRAERRRSAGP